ncbi:MAG: sigma-E processing peptidase SpoIIGA [Clostridia bacterium]|nr:sigma-E processing peptidase SpoIIGA [Clostridia bacterium]
MCKLIYNFYMELYVEDVFLVNFAVDFVLLYLTQKLVLNEFLLNATLIVSVLGGIFGVFAPFLFFSELLRIIFIVIFAIVALLILKFRGKKLIYGVIVLLLLSLLLGGIILSFYNVDMFLGNSLKKLFYIILGLLITTIFAVIAIKYIKSARAINCFLYDVEIFHKGKKVQLKAFLDTGNMLENEFGEGICVVSFFDVFELLENPNITSYPKLSVNYVSSYGTLRQAIFEKIVIYGKDFANTYNNVVFAMSINRLTNGQFDVILSPRLLTQKEDL